MDDNDTARLTTGGRSSIVAEPGTSVANLVQSEAIEGGAEEFRYMAPEIQFLEQNSDTGENDKIRVTKESGVYAIGMVVYEASSHRPPLSSPMVKSHVESLGFDREPAVLRMER